MAHSYNTIPLRILFDAGVSFKKNHGKKEYSFGKTKASGPGGLDCHCCYPHMGYYRDGKAKPKMRRYLRRVSKRNMFKEIVFEMDAINKEFEEMMADLAYDYDDYDYYDPWDMYCVDQAAEYYDQDFYYDYEN